MKNFVTGFLVEAQIAFAENFLNEVPRCQMLQKRYYSSDPDSGSAKKVSGSGIRNLGRNQPGSVTLLFRHQMKAFLAILGNDI
jgi:hypothetical protein